MIDDIEIQKVTVKLGDNIHVNGHYLRYEDNKVGDNYNLEKAKLNGSIVGKHNSISAAEKEDDSLFKKPIFYAGIAVFIYFCLALFAAYDLQNGGKLGNKTFERIVLAPIPFLTIDEKKP